MLIVQDGLFLPSPDLSLCSENLPSPVLSTLFKGVSKPLKRGSSV